MNEIDLSRADLNLFVLFETVLNEGHVGRAAKRLNLSQSAVSHGLGRLRRFLDDPVFLRTPRGVVPTARALELATPIAEVLAGARRVVALASPFDPGTSKRAFTVGAPDGGASFLVPLMARLRNEAPGVDVRLRQLLPGPARDLEQGWEPIFADLDARRVDMAVGPFPKLPDRFHAHALWDEDFVIIARQAHPLVRTTDIATYCAADHLVVSQSGDPFGFVDLALAERGLTRRVALTVPAFFMALAVVAATDLVAAVPRSFAHAHASPAGLSVIEVPLALPHFTIRAALPRAALGDPGVAWLLALLASTVR
jgi:DNA-binding transcriptional LysR family regulator